MRIRSLFFVVAVNTVVVVAGCATDRDAVLQQQTLSIQRGAFLLSATNAEPGQTYELGVYVITRGDTLAKIAQESQVSMRELMTINPGLDPGRLVVGQKVRIYERRKE
jgi:LysM repeat protein